MNERLSAYLDGESAAHEESAALGELLADGDCAARWSAYHLIGDALRGTVTTGIDREALAARIAAEPAILAPAALPARAARVPRRARGWMSAAAGVAAVAFVGWVAMPSFGPGPGRFADRGAQPGSTGVAGPADGVTTVAAPAGLQAPTMVATAQRPAIVPAALGVQDYLIAHQRFSSSSAMQGAMPYVRLMPEQPRSEGSAR